MEVAVVGVPDPDKGEIPRAYLVLHPNVKKEGRLQEVVEEIKNYVHGKKLGLDFKTFFYDHLF